MFLEKIFKKDEKDLDIEIGKEEIYPVRDWKLMVIGAVLLSFILAVVGLYFYINAVSDDPFSSIEDSSVSSKQFINKNTLEEALNFFLNKEKISQSIIDGSGAVEDPSI